MPYRTTKKGENKFCVEKLNSSDIWEEMKCFRTRKQASMYLTALNIAEDEAQYSKASYMLKDLIVDRNVPIKYRGLNFYPTEEMVENAQAGLNLRAKQPPSNRCCTPVGIARARDIVNKKRLNPTTIKRMYSFFSRHEVDKQSESWKDPNSKARQAWLVWGGDAGFAWSKKLVEKINEIEEAENKQDD